MESQIVLPGSATLRLDWKLAVICCCSPHLGACEDRCPARKKHLRNKNTHDRHKVWYSGLPLGFRPRAPNAVMQLQTSLSQALCFRLGKHRTHEKEQNSSLTLSFVSKGHHTPLHDCLPPILRREDHRMQRTQNSHCRPPHLQVMFLSVIRHTLVSPIKHQGRRDRASATAGKRLLQIQKRHANHETSPICILHAQEYSVMQRQDVPLLPSRFQTQSTTQTTNCTQKRSH